MSTMAAEFEQYLARSGVICSVCCRPGQRATSAEEGAKLQLNHLTRAQLWLLAAQAGVDIHSDRTVLLSRLEAQLISQLPYDCVLSSLPGMVPACEYPSVVMTNRYSLLLFGGSQQGIPEIARTQLATVPADALWHCSLLGGQWRCVPAAGNTPGARSGQSAVMYRGKARRPH